MSFTLEDQLTESGGGSVHIVLAPYSRPIRFTSFRKHPKIIKT
jgi:hypothetical protein